MAIGRQDEPLVDGGSAAAAGHGSSKFGYLGLTYDDVLLLPADPPKAGKTIIGKTGD